MPTTTITEVRKNLLSIGDCAKEAYDQSKDLTTALVAIKAYGEATKTAVAQIRYKQQTGSPTRITFLEE
jgi:hypothetical protein